LNLVRDVDDLCCRLNSEDYAFHRAGEVVNSAEVGGESDRPFWHGGAGPHGRASRMLAQLAAGNQRQNEHAKTNYPKYITCT
jgi:hypothetical protein